MPCIASRSRFGVSTIELLAPSSWGCIETDSPFQDWSSDSMKMMLGRDAWVLPDAFVCALPRATRVRTAAVRRGFPVVEMFILLAVGDAAELARTQ